MTQYEAVSPTAHALLFGWIARGVVQAVGEARGEALLRRAVRVYGAQRGHRMALRAAQDGETLNMRSYMLYGEWSAPAGAMHSEDLEGDPHLRSRVYRCPWSSAWREEGLLPYGKYYCMEIDEALVRGFNPALRLDVGGTLSGGAACCEFVLHDAELTPEHATQMEARQQALGDRARMPWEYHCAHLYWSLAETLQMDAVLAEALLAFGERYGEAAVQAILAYEGEDFNELPG